MNTYKIYELQNANSTRRPYLNAYFANTLTAAKRKASQLQMFQDTVMVIYDNHGTLLATKNGKKWTEATYN